MPTLAIIANSKIEIGKQWRAIAKTLLRVFAHWAIAEQRPYVHFSADGTELFLKTIEASDALKARARGIREEFTDVLTEALAKAAKLRLPDSAASLAASMLVATWVVASLEAHRIFRQSRDLKKSHAVFLAIVDKGIMGAKAAAAGARYA